ncbi:hypothetical protein [Campylobacter showae]|nr:hypothetical protein [Campylobacter showae]
MNEKTPSKISNLKPRQTPNPCRHKYSGRMDLWVNQIYKRV